MANDTYAVYLGDIIAAPILATVDADFQAARKFVDYIQEFGFTRVGGKSGDFGDLKMVRFAFPEQTPDGGVRTKVMQLPELSLVPLPILQVDKADYSFGIRIISSENARPVGRLDLLGKPETLPDPNRYRWAAMLAPSARQKSGELQPDADPHINANVQAQISVRVGDVPAGISRILALLGSDVMILNGFLQFDHVNVSVVPNGPPAAVTLKVLLPTRAPAPGVTVGLISSISGIEVKTGDTPWAGREQRKADANGEIKFTVAAAATAAPGDAYKLRFSATIDGGDVECNLPVTISAPGPARR
ncbi:MAG: DUF2589 domain-containing protein [Rhodanobacteraceae bacterium]|nr:MAG: DUF2589 domain-containing protein [Rhodanobacteraceae bacterium]